ncbi:MAG: FkbM family methyltransferase [Deltaproteobacteria bacterium]|nr:FkbM family methyltransferase [Deltaproteobacteria bacterium]
MELDSVYFDLDIPYAGKISLRGSRQDNSIVKPIMETGSYEPKLMRLLNDLLKPGDTFLDLGANIGVMSVAASYYVGPSGMVIAVEAGKINFEYLKENMERRGIENYKLFNCGVWDYETTLKFSYVPQVAGCSFFSTTGIEEGNVEVVQCRTVDGILSGLNNPHINLTKIDVEGAELKALTGMDRTIERCRPNIIFELNNGTLKRFFDITPEKIWDFFTERGYSLFDFNEGEELLKISTPFEFSNLTSGEKGWTELLARPC